jgi:segregation and condensation protein B
MTVVEDGETVALLPHRAFAHLVERAVEADTIPRLTAGHLEVIAIVVHTGAVTRRRIDEVRGVDSAETVAQLMEWGLLRREGAEGRAPLYRATAKLLEVTGARLPRRTPGPPDGWRGASAFLADRPLT